ncbi:MAG: calcium/sodium antiporter [Balneolales bacterium]
MFLFISGLLLLIAGAELLVRGASRLAAAFRISPLVIGLTVVAFGTGAPELAVSVQAAVTGQGDIAVGNVIGSNILNILLVIGLSALVLPMAVSPKLIRLDIPLLILVSLAVLFLALDGTLSRPEGFSLFVVLIIYTVFLFRQSRREYDKEDHPAEPGASGKSRLMDTGFIIAGLVMLITGSDWMVDGAVLFAEYLGVSELIIGLTVVSLGTSLPELITSLVAGFRNERNIAAGNIVGSCLFNLLGVLGVAGLITPGGLSILPSVIGFDIPVMIATAFACLPIFFTGGMISRWEGALFLAFYLAYTLYLFLAATHHDALSLFSTTMLYFVAPLTVLTLIILVMQELRNGRK